MADELYIAVPEGTPFSKIRKAVNKQARRRKARIGMFEIGEPGVDCVRELGISRPDLLWDAGFEPAELDREAYEDPPSEAGRDFRLARSIFLFKDLLLDPPPWALIDPEGNWVEETAIIRKRIKELPPADRKRFRSMERKVEDEYGYQLRKADDRISQLCDWIIEIEKDDPDHHPRVRRFFEAYNYNLIKKATLPIRTYMCWPYRRSEKESADLSKMYAEDEEAAQTVEEIFWEQLNSHGYQKQLKKIKACCECVGEYYKQEQKLYVDFLQELTQKHPGAIVVAGIASLP